MTQCQSTATLEVVVADNVLKTAVTLRCQLDDEHEGDHGHTLSWDDDDDGLGDPDETFDVEVDGEPETVDDGVECGEPWSAHHDAPLCVLPLGHAGPHSIVP